MPTKTPDQLDELDQRSRTLPGIDTGLENRTPELESQLDDLEAKSQGITPASQLPTFDPQTPAVSLASPPSTATNDDFLPPGSDIPAPDSLLSPDAIQARSNLALGGNFVEPTAPTRPNASWTDIASRPAYQSLSPDEQSFLATNYAGRMRDYLSSLPGSDAVNVDKHINDFLTSKLTDIHAAPPPDLSVRHQYENAKSVAYAGIQKIALESVQGALQVSAPELYRKTSPEQVEQIQTSLADPNLPQEERTRLEGIAEKIKPTSEFSQRQQEAQTTAKGLAYAAGTAEKQAGVDPKLAETAVAKTTQFLTETGTMIGVGSIPGVGPAALGMQDAARRYAETYNSTGGDEKAARHAGTTSLVSNALFLTQGAGVIAGVEKILPQGTKAIAAWAAKASAATGGNIATSQLIKAAEAAHQAPEGKKAEAFSAAFKDLNLSDAAVQTAFGVVAANHSAVNQRTQATKTAVEQFHSESQQASKLEEVGLPEAAKAQRSVAHENLTTQLSEADKAFQEAQAQIPNAKEKRPTYALATEIPKELLTKDSAAPEEGLKLNAAQNAEIAGKTQADNPAVLSKGKIGQTHKDLADEIIKNPDVTDEQLDAAIEAGTNDKLHGFQDSEGNALDRQKAAEIAVKAGQIKPEFENLYTEGKGTLQSQHLQQPTKPGPYIEGPALLKAGENPNEQTSKIGQGNNQAEASAKAPVNAEEPVLNDGLKLEDEQTIAANAAAEGARSDELPSKKAGSTVLEEGASEELPTGESSEAARSVQESAPAHQQATAQAAAEALNKGSAPPDPAVAEGIARNYTTVNKTLRQFSVPTEGRELMYNELRDDILNNIKKTGDPFKMQLKDGTVVPYNAKKVFYRRVSDYQELHQNAKSESLNATDAEGNPIVQEPVEQKQSPSKEIADEETLRGLKEKASTSIASLYGKFSADKNNRFSVPDASPAEVNKAARIVLEEIGRQRTGQRLGFTETRGIKPETRIGRLLADEEFRSAVEDQVFEPLRRELQPDIAEAGDILPSKEVEVGIGKALEEHRNKKALNLASDQLKSGIPLDQVVSALPDKLQAQVKGVAEKYSTNEGINASLRKVAEAPATTPEAQLQQTLAKALSLRGDNSRVIVDPTLEVRRGSAAEFIPRTGDIRVSPFLGEAKTAEALNHEKTHAVLYDKREAYNRGDFASLDPGDVAGFRELDKLTELLRQNAPEEAQKIFAAKTLDEQQKLFGEALAKDHSFAKYGALVGNGHELLTYILNHREFQEWANTIKTDGTPATSKSSAPTIWNRLKQILRSITFGKLALDENSVLAKGFDLTVDLLKSGSADDISSGRFFRPEEGLQLPKSEPFDVAKYEAQKKDRFLTDYAAQHGFKSADDLAASDPHLYNEAVALHGEPTGPLEGLRMAAEDSTVQDKTAERASGLYKKIDKLGVDSEEVTRTAMENGATTAEQFAAAFSRAGLEPETARAVGNAVEAHFHLAGLETASKLKATEVQANTERSEADKANIEAAETGFKRDFREAKSRMNQLRSLLGDHLKEILGAEKSIEQNTGITKERETVETNPVTAQKATYRAAEKAGEAGFKRGVVEGTAAEQERSAESLQQEQIASQKASFKAQDRAGAAGVRRGVRETKGMLDVRDRWLAGDQERVRQDITDYVSKTLPPDERGRFIGAVTKLLRRTPLLHGDPTAMYRNAFKLMQAVENRAEEVYKGNLIDDIKKEFTKGLESPSVDVAYRRQLKDLYDTVSLSKPTKATLFKLRALEDFVNREKAAGRDITVPQEHLDQLKRLSQMPIKDMTTNAVEQLLNDVRTTVALGKTKANLLERRWELDKKRAVGELRQAPSSPMEKRALYKAQPTEKLTTGQKFVNAVQRTLNAGNLFERVIATIDEIYDHLDGAFGTYNGWASRNIKGRLDLDFNSEQSELQPIIRAQRDVAKKFNLKKADMEAIGIHGIMKMVGKDRLLEMGVRPDIVARIEKTPLTPGQQAYYNHTRSVYDAMGKRVQDVAHKLYQEDFKPIENYMPLQRDWAAYRDGDGPSPSKDPIAGEVPFDEKATLRALLHDMNPDIVSRTQQGFLKERLEGAKTAVKLNAQELFERHLNDALHFIHTQPSLKFLGEIVRSEDFKSHYGDLGQKVVLDHLDSVATQGVVGHDRRIRALDWVRNSTSKGAVGFRLASNIVHASQMPLAAYHAGGAGWWSKGLQLALTERGQVFLQKHAAETYARSGGEPAQADVEAFSKFGKAGFFIARNIDKLTSQATFLGRYLKESAGKGLDPDSALASPVDPEIQSLALRRMHRAVASPFVKDVPQMTSRGAGVGGNVSFARAINQFRNIFLDNYSGLRHDILRVGYADAERVVDLFRQGEVKQGVKDFGESAAMRVAVASALLMGVAMETGIKMYVKQGLQQGTAAITGVQPPQKKDQEDHDFTAEFKHHLVNRVPFVGQLATAFQYGETGVPVIDAFVNPIKEAGVAYKSKKPETKAKHIVKAASAAATVLGIPGSSQALELANPAVSEVLKKTIPDTSSKKGGKKGF